MDVSVLVATKAGSIMGPIASVFGYIMDFLFRITSSMGIMNIGLCIILFTIITKLLLFPLTIKQQESSKLMSLMNPEIKAVQNRDKGKTDQASMAKQQVEMQAVYEKYGRMSADGDSASDYLRFVPGYLQHSGIRTVSTCLF